MKILVLGHTGFLGSHVCRLLASTSHEVFMSSRTTGTDLRDFENFEKLIVATKPDVVINCAAHVGGIHYGINHQAEIYIDNLLININLYKLANLFGYRVLNPISNCAYPMDSIEFCENEIWNGPLDPTVLTYGSVRRLNLVASSSFWNQFQIRSINLVFPNLYGEGDHLDPVRAHALGAMTFRFLQAKLSGAEYVEVWGTGSPIREWFHVEDAARYVIESLSLTWTDEVFNIGWGAGISVLELAHKIKACVEFKGEIRLNQALPDGAPCKIMNTDKARKVFTISPSIGLDEGISRTVQWYSSQLSRGNK